MLTDSVASVLKEGTFKGKVAVVTGGGTGIGKAIARELLELGCNVVIASRKRDILERTKAELEALEATSKAGAQVDLVEANIRDEEQVDKMIKFAIERFGRLDILVNNAGGQFVSPVEAISSKGWRSVVDLNLNGTFWACKAACSEWMQEHGGTIINVVANFYGGFPLMAHTGAARAAVANLTQTLAIEWAQYGIRVAAVAPGVIFSESALQHYKENGGQLGENPLAAAAPLLPANRLGSCEEVSSVVCFLLSPGASYITGVTVPIDGGQSLGNSGLFPLQKPTNYPQHGTLPLESKL